MKKAILIASIVFSTGYAAADVSLDRCVELACENYPLIHKYDLLSATSELDLSDINKGWLPKIGVYVQGTAQNVVPSFPNSLSNVMNQLGSNIEGLGKLQYKVGVDISQPVWDGGVSKSQREISRRKTDVNRAIVDVDMYSIRQRVQQYYFAILLVESQISQIESAISVYEANLLQLQNMLKNGVAMQADVDMLDARLLDMSQQLILAKAACKGYRNILSVFTSSDLHNEKLILPSPTMPETLESNRPELKLINARNALNNARLDMIKSSNMPKIGFFAQSYYGYPGIDYFKAMMSRDFSFNILAGLKLSWNIDSFYGNKNSRRRIQLENEEADNDRDIFLFNSSLQTTSILEEIDGYKAVMEDDQRIVNLRKNVRMAAESGLRNGVIDVTALTVKINDETQALLTSSLHRIQYVQAIYNLKNCLNIH